MHQFPAGLTDCAAMVVAEAAAVGMSREDIGSFKNKAVYMPIREGITDGRMDGRTDTCGLLHCVAHHFHIKISCQNHCN